MEELNQGNELPKKSKKGLLAKLAILIVLIIALCFGYLYMYNTPKTTFLRYIDKIVTSSEKSGEEQKTLKAEYEIKGSITEAKDEEIEAVKDILENSKLALKVQLDRENKTESLGMKVDMNNENLIDVLGVIDAKNEKTYLHVEDLFDKFVEISMEEEQAQELTKSFESITTMQKISLKNANKIIQKEIKEQLEDKYFASERIEIKLDEKRVKTTKSTATFKVEELLNIVDKITTNLSNNEEFIKCFEEEADIKETLQNISKQIKELDIYGNTTIKVSLYTHGLFAKLAKVDVEIIDESENERCLIEIIKTNDEVIDFNVNATIDGRANVNACKGQIKVKENDDKSYNIDITADIIEVGVLKIEMYVKAETNVALDEIDTSNSVKMEEMTEDDYMTIMENLQIMPLGQMIFGLMGTSAVDTDLDSGLDF